jgi:transposase
VIADGTGRAIAFARAPGQAPELPLAPGLLGCLSDIPGRVVGDRGLASHAFRDLVWDSGARPSLPFHALPRAEPSAAPPAIPSKRNEEPVACPPWIYQNRNRVERLWGRLKEWRAVATRYEKTARSFLGVLCLAAAADWIKL